MRLLGLLFLALITTLSAYWIWHQNRALALRASAEQQLEKQNSLLKSEVETLKDKVSSDEARLAEEARAKAQAQTIQDEDAQAALLKKQAQLQAQPDQKKKVRQSVTLDELKAQLRSAQDDLKGVEADQKRLAATLHAVDQQSRQAHTTENKAKGVRAKERRARIQAIKKSLNADAKQIAKLQKHPSGAADQITGIQNRDSQLQAELSSLQIEASDDERNFAARKADYEFNVSADKNEMGIDRTELDRRSADLKAKIQNLKNEIETLKRSK